MNTYVKVMKRSISISLIIFVMLFPISLSGQTHYIIQELPLVQNNLKGKLSSFTIDEKIKMLSLLPENEKIEFEFPTGSLYDEETEYFPLDTFGLNYIDLNFDGRSDLIYSSQSGNMGIMSSKIYINEGNILKYKCTVSGGLLHIEKSGSSYNCYFVWYPCCDSYTSRISKYSFSKDQFAEKEFVISVIGLKHLKGLPDFEGNKVIKIKDPSLYAKPEDFRLTVPYFRERNKNIRDSLKAGFDIKLIDLKGDITFYILETNHNLNQTWHFVISETINELPKSLYEWSTGDKRRLIGWIKDEGKKH